MLPKFCNGVRNGDLCKSGILERSVTNQRYFALFSDSIYLKYYLCKIY